MEKDMKTQRCCEKKLKVALVVHRKDGGLVGQKRVVEVLDARLIRGKIRTW